MRFGNADAVQQEVRLYFNQPQQLLSIFTDLEDENLKLIQKCQEAEDKAEEVKKTTAEVSEARIFLSRFAKSG